MEKRRNCSLGAISPLFHNILLPVLRFHVKTGTRISLRNKRLFEISEVEVTRVDCIRVREKEKNICLNYILRKKNIREKKDGTTVSYKNSMTEKNKKKYGRRKEANITILSWWGKHAGEKKLKVWVKEEGQYKKYCPCR